MGWDDRGSQQGPPDLDALLRRFQMKFKKFFSSKKSASGDGSTGGMGSVGAILIVGLLFFVWLISGIFIVSPAESGVVLRFGKYVESVGPGPHWIPRFIDTRYVVNIQQVSTFPYQAEMLTKDENIVSVALAVQYRIDNANDYLFNVVNPVASLQQATASALRQVVGHTTLDDILTSGRQQVREQVAKQLKEILAIYQPGILVTDVTLQPAKPPEAVTEAFDDAIKAREDEQRYINQAVAYQQKVVPIANGQAARILQAAGAFQKQVVLQAKANTASFLALLPEYKHAPKVTRERLYISSLESVFDHTSKILVDVKGGNIMYIPLDKMLKSEQSSVAMDRLAKVTKLDSKKAQQTSYSTRPSRVGYPLNGGSY